MKPKRKPKKCKNCDLILSDRRKTFCNSACESEHKSKSNPDHSQKDPEYKGNDVSTRFKPGNEFWKARSTCGRKPIFSDPEVLRTACYEYFQWVEDNPLKELKVFSSGISFEVPKMMMMTIQGLCLFLDISDDAWADYRNNPVLSGIVREAERIIYQQKITGAAADFLNANIVCREMGLADKKEVTGKDGGPIKTSSDMTLDEATRLYLDGLKG